MFRVYEGAWIPVGYAYYLDCGDPRQQVYALSETRIRALSLAFVL